MGLHTGFDGVWGFIPQFIIVTTFSALNKLGQGSAPIILSAVTPTDINLAREYNVAVGEISARVHLLKRVKVADIQHGRSRDSKPF